MITPRGIGNLLWFLFVQGGLEAIALLVGPFIPLGVKAYATTLSRKKDARANELAWIEIGDNFVAVSLYMVVVFVPIDWIKLVGLGALLIYMWGMALRTAKRLEENPFVRFAKDGFNNMTMFACVLSAIYIMFKAFAGGAAGAEVWDFLTRQNIAGNDFTANITQTVIEKSLGDFLLLHGVLAWIFVLGKFAIEQGKVNSRSVGAKSLVHYGIGIIVLFLRVSGIWWLAIPAFFLFFGNWMLYYGRFFWKKKEELVDVSYENIYVFGITMFNLLLLGDIATGATFWQLMVALYSDFT